MSTGKEEWVEIEVRVDSYMFFYQKIRKEYALSNEILGKIIFAINGINDKHRIIGKTE